MLMTDIIAKKRDKIALTDREIAFFVKGAANKSIPDYQLSALLMAICINGMNEEETACLALQMAHSGDVLDLSSLGPHTADKHSTGGIGDKTTLIAAPIAAALGCSVAKMSGRGLGHTGGTVDKLEAISGYKTSLDVEEFLNTAKNIGICITGHGGGFAPADKTLYALRDVTSTVESIPLIASSIMSKKIAAGAKALVLDVKIGKGAFMKELASAEELAKAMVKIGKNAGIKTCALITDMNIPLGNKIGNALEVSEALEILSGKGDERLTELSLMLAANMYSLSFGETMENSLKKAKTALRDGSALEKLTELVDALGGDTALITGEKSFPRPDCCLPLISPCDGYISQIDGFLVGKAACLSGAGRETLEDKLDPSAGIEFKKSYGDFVKKGEAVAEIMGKQEKLGSALEVLKTALFYSNEKPSDLPLIYKTIY